MTSKEAELEKRIEFLEGILKNQGIDACPACGGVMRQSPKFSGNFYCQQQNGHCGEWVLRTIPPRTKRGSWPHTHFERTRVKDGRVERFGGDDIFRRVVFIAGKAVDYDPFAGSDEEE